MGFQPVPVIEQTHQAQLSCSPRPGTPGKGLGVRGNQASMLPLTPDPSPRSTGERGEKKEAEPQKRHSQAEPGNEFTPSFARQRFMSFEHAFEVREARPSSLLQPAMHFG